MQEPNPPASELEAELPSRPQGPPGGPPRGHPVVAWSVLTIVVLLLFGQANAPQPPAEPTADDPVAVVLMEIQARIIVGSADALRHLPGGGVPSGEDHRFDAALGLLEGGSVEQRLRYIVLVGELRGPHGARDSLLELEEKLQENDIVLTPAQVTVCDALRRLYAEAGPSGAPALDDDTRRVFEEELGWFARLALAPRDGAAASERREVLIPAYRSLVAYFAGISWFVVIGAAGFVGLIIMIVLLATRRLRGGLEDPCGFGGIYIETFTVWIVLFSGLQLLSGLLPPYARWPAATGAFLLSLTALAWPVFRGAPWAQVRRDIGLTLGGGALREVVIGLGCYAMCLPLLAAGAACTYVLVLVQGMFRAAGAGDSFESMGGPAHPIVEVFATPGWGQRLAVLFVGVIVAPVVEETMFRGVLYRHLRDATWRFGRAGSALLSALATMVVFAAIHPQGWVAFPALGALAFGFAMAREWRRSLIPAMVAHGTSNGFVIVLLMAMA